MKGSPAKLGVIQGTAGHASALKMMENSSPLRGCAEDPTGKGCGNFKIKGTGKKKIKRAVHKAGKWVENIFRKKNKKKNKKKKTSSNTSYQSSRTLSTSGEGGSDYTGG